MELHEILTRLAGITKRLEDAGISAYSTLTMWDAEMTTQNRGERSRMFIRVNIYGSKSRKAYEIYVGGWDIAAMFVECDKQITRYLEAEDLLAKTLGIEVAA